MPRVKKLSEDADSLVAIKKRVNSRNKRKYAVPTGDPLVAKADASLPLYNGLLSRLQNVVASVGEIRGALELTNEYFNQARNPQWARSAIDRFLAVNANVKKSVADLNSFLEQNIRSLNIFSDGQVSSIRKLNDELTDTFRAIIAGVNVLPAKRRDSLRKLFSVFVDDLTRLSQMMGSLLGNYKQLPSEAPFIEAIVPTRPTGQGRSKKAPAPPVAVPAGEGFGDNMLARHMYGSDPRTYTPHGMMGGIYLEIKEMPTRFL